MKSKGTDQYVDIDDDDDEELELKNTVPLTYKMPKVAKYDGIGDPTMSVNLRDLEATVQKNDETFADCMARWRAKVT
ncbi:hypothetical protein JCGZ_10858 [Jatropha curcas]|uniref:Uncharacterized protein n=1 Tax=Jatropha curcas TaxID=180498 RepID=A0A067KT61_JATCU|nr:hypothetical protein JCGZ_10858 [Jatropha curcas]